MSKVAWARARIRRERPHIPEYSAEKLRERSREVRRCAEIAAFMGDDGPASDELYAFAEELACLANDQQVRIQLDASAKRTRVAGKQAKRQVKEVAK